MMVDLKTHLIWLPKYPGVVLTGEVALRTLEVIHDIADEYRIQVLFGKTTPDYVHLFAEYKSDQDIGEIVEGIKNKSSCILLQEFIDLHEIIYDKDLWEKGYLAVSPEVMTNQIPQKYIEELKGEIVSIESVSGSEKNTTKIDNGKI